MQVCIRIPADHATSARNSSRCAPEIHGRVPCGVTKRQVLSRIIPRPNHRACAYETYVHASMSPCKRFSGVSYETSDQLNDVSAAKQARDVSATIDLIDYLNERDPFVQNDSLSNVANGMTAQERLKKSTDEFIFWKANQAVMLGSRATVKIKGENANVDQQLLFQRLLTGREHCDDVTSQFQYELCPYLAALFESLSLPLQPNKAVRADYVWKSMKEEQRNPSRDVQYVFDGSGLLHRVPWPRGSICESVSHLYASKTPLICEDWGIV